MDSQSRCTGYTIVELMISLVIAALVTLAAVQILLVNQGYFTRMTLRSELMASALTAKELLYQAVWKAGHRTRTQQSDVAISVSGTAPQGHLQTGYVLDSTGTYLGVTCAGNRRSHGRNLVQTLDDWYPRVDGSLYCDPNTSAGASLTERVAGAEFLLVQADTRSIAGNTSRLVTGRKTVRNNFTRAVNARLVFVADSPPANSKRVTYPWHWPLLQQQSARAGYSIFWQLVMPVAIDIDQ